MTARFAPRRLHRYPMPGLIGESGVTLVEVMFTALIVVLLAAATATALISTARASGGEQFRSEADALAVQDQEQLRSLSDEQLNALQSGTQRYHTVPLGGITFTLTSGANFRSTSGSAGVGCSTSTAASYEITSRVTWTENNQPRSVEVDSLLTRPVVGQLVVPATDASSSSLSGVTVTAAASGVGQQTAVTNGAGCALFAGLTPGPTYTVTLAKPGYVDKNGNKSATLTVAVPSAGATASASLGQASGPINATFRAMSGATGETDGLSWSMSGMSRPGTTASATTFTTATSTNTLFPGTYAIWAGQCASQEPPSGSVTSVAVSPGQSTAGQPVSEPTLQVNVVAVLNGTTYAIKPADIVETFRGGSCVDSWAATVSSASTEPTTGWLANPGQPYAAGGTLSVCADFYYSNQWYQATVVPGGGNSSFSTAANANAVTVSLNGSTTGQCALQTS